MLDIPFASRDRTFDDVPMVERDGGLASRYWQPRLFLVPAWRLDAKARLIKRLIDVGAALAGSLTVVRYFGSSLTP